MQVVMLLFGFPTDLMLPGLVVPPAGLPQVQKGDLCAITLVGNRYCTSPLCLWGENLGKTGERNRKGQITKLMEKD